MFELLGVPPQALFGQVLLGLINGSFYAILSLGLAVIFGLLNIINFTHGAQYMMGAFVAWMCLNYLGVNYWAALVLAPVIVGVTVSILATALGFGAAYTDFRYRFFGKSLYLALALLPPTIPVVILGLAMLAFLANIGLSGGIHSVIIAHVVMCAPFAMAIIRLRLSQMDPALEAAAWNLGASQWVAMRHVILLFCRPAIFAALFITMAVSFDEFAVSWFVSGLNETLPVKVLGFLQGQVSPKINVIGTFVFLTTMTLVVLAQILLMKRSRSSTGTPS